MGIDKCGVVHCDRIDRIRRTRDDAGETHRTRLDCCCDRCQGDDPLVLGHQWNQLLCIVDKEHATAGGGHCSQDASLRLLDCCANKIAPLHLHDLSRRQQSKSSVEPTNQRGDLILPRARIARKHQVKIVRNDWLAIRHPHAVQLMNRHQPLDSGLDWSKSHELVKFGQEVGNRVGSHGRTLPTASRRRAQPRARR